MKKKQSQNSTPSDDISRDYGPLMPPSKSAPFKSADELLEVARQMFMVRAQVCDTIRECEQYSGDNVVPYLRHLERCSRAWTRYWHQSFSMTDLDLELCKRGKEAKLNRIEREILLLLILDRLALVIDSSCVCSTLLQQLNIEGSRAIPALRAMSEEGRLYRSRLIAYEDDSEDLRDRRLVVDPVLVDTVISGQKRNSFGWPVKSEGEFNRHLCRLTQALQRKSDTLDSVVRGFGSQAEFFKHTRRVERLLRGALQTLEANPQWGASRLLEETRAVIRPGATVILLALMGKELGHINADDELFSGGGLARAISNNAEEVPLRLMQLQPNDYLLQSDFVQPCGGMDNYVSDDPKDLEETEFELTEKSLGVLSITKRMVKERDNTELVRSPMVKMSHLVLADKVRRVLDMATAQARHQRVLVDTWGLGEMIPYGRAMTMLFSGPPGVGKTACAEAMAHDLGKPIMVADYSQLQNCLVGQTEKNIVRIFRTAKAHDAVLFWDEADAMFFNRDSATRSWEVRDVNVLLQELERFDGVCVLASNRKISLDPALERRVTLKVEFETPNLAMRRQIWEKMLPASMPLGPDISLDQLSKSELTGGEIKNVVLNAARLALCRGAEGPVTASDFTQALEMETGNRWSRGKSAEIGFKK